MCGQVQRANPLLQAIGAHTDRQLIRAGQRYWPREGTDLVESTARTASSTSKHNRSAKPLTNPGKPGREALGEQSKREQPRRAKPLRPTAAKPISKDAAQAEKQSDQLIDAVLNQLREHFGEERVSRYFTDDQAKVSLVGNAPRFGPRAPLREQPATGVPVRRRR